MSEIKLFAVRTVLKSFKGHENVPISWFMDERPSPIYPYEHMILDYRSLCGDSKSLSEECADEFFSESEGELLVPYLKDTYGSEFDRTTAEPVRLPLRSNGLPFSAIPLGGGVDLVLIWRKDGYSLPFKVGGFFDLRHDWTFQGEHKSRTSSLWGSCEL
jgi:hypothetical protein